MGWFIFILVIFVVVILVLNIICVLLGIIWAIVVFDLIVCLGLCKDNLNIVLFVGVMIILLLSLVFICFSFLLLVVNFLINLVCLIIRFCLFLVNCWVILGKDKDSFKIVDLIDDLFILLFFVMVNCDWYWKVWGLVVVKIWIFKVDICWLICFNFMLYCWIFFCSWVFWWFRVDLFMCAIVFFLWIIWFLFIFILLILFFVGVWIIFMFFIGWVIVFVFIVGLYFIRLIRVIVVLNVFNKNILFILF